jgi:carbon starvation protein
MNSIFILLISLALFYWGWKFYAGKMEKIMELDPERKTPAFTQSDGVDYIPARNWLVLFGHHFSSIAGAGPVVGPVLAVMLWGWLPALVWVIVGTIFVGGIHDFAALFISVREQGHTLGDIAGRLISREVKIIFLIFLWLALILVIAVFAFLCADTFVKEPKIVLPSLGLIPVATVVGFLLYRLNFNNTLTTIFGLSCLVALIFLGNFFPIRLGLEGWLAILFFYCLVASVLPVNVLLQPRDYLSSFLLLFGVGAGFIGLLFSHPDISMPAVLSLRSTEGLLWPGLFITVACGAISGFHSLISSGTSSKQIQSEKHIKRIGYGGMIAEGIVAVLAIISVSILFQRGDDFSAILKTEGPINIFSRGFGVITADILGGNGPFIAVTILNAFILTTLDTATRITRYIAEELFQIKNRYLSTLLIVALSAILALSGKWQKIWQIFGASNQLIAALALLIITYWFMSHKKSIRFTLPAAIFMLITTIFALILRLVAFYDSNDYLLLAICFALIVLALFMVYKTVRIKDKNG